MENSSRAEQTLPNLNHQVSELKRNACDIVFAVAYSAACFGQSGNDPSSKVELRLSQNNAVPFEQYGGCKEWRDGVLEYHAERKAKRLAKAS
jgi:hypothetical protein